MRWEYTFPASGTPEEKAEFVLETLKLDHGDGYGASYFTRANSAVLSTAFAQHPECCSLEELRQIVEGLPLTEKEKSDAVELLMKLRAACED